MKKSSRRVLTFMRRNALYLILAACILAVGLSITLMLVNRNAGTQIDNPPVVDTTTPDDPGVGTITPENPDDTEPVQKPVQFIMPVEHLHNHIGHIVYALRLGLEDLRRHLFVAVQQVVRNILLYQTAIFG